jgi:protein-S-isoprenylcysteine O-methyltransferase Ste14
LNQRRLSRHLKAIWVTIAVVLVTSLLWFAGAMFFSGASSLSVVRQWGFITFGVGLALAILVVAVMWWREHRPVERGNREDT